MAVPLTATRGLTHASLERDYERALYERDEYQLRRIQEESQYRIEMERARLGSTLPTDFIALPKIAPAPKKKFDPNEVASLTMALSALVDIWRVQFADKWVSDGVVAAMPDKTFWAHAEKRLRMHDSFENYENWYRLKEETK